jgi:hypothetical protein
MGLLLVSPYLFVCSLNICLVTEAWADYFSRIPTTFTRTLQGPSLARGSSLSLTNRMFSKLVSYSSMSNRRITAAKVVYNSA